ncbi:MAG: OmpA family protein [Muribaculaceae bacterium]|nr:OmpA family protein [Muribaculaceae bacterium]
MKGLIRIFSLLMLAVAMAPAAHAQIELNPYPDYNEEIFMDMDFEPNLATPSVGKQEKKAVARYVKSVAETYKKKYRVDLMREGEVMVITIPTDDLFLPNDTLITRRGFQLLTPLLEPMKQPYMFKVVYAIHTDDTGSDSYREALSSARVASVYDWLMDMIDQAQISEDLVIIPYSMASSDPLESNDTREGRRQNRRLEFYFVPGPQMIEKASKKQLKEIKK